MDGNGRRWLSSLGFSFWVSANFQGRLLLNFQGIICVCFKEKKGANFIQGPSLYSSLTSPGCLCFLSMHKRFIIKLITFEACGSWRISMGKVSFGIPPKKITSKAIELPRSRFQRRCHISMGRWMVGWPRWLPSLSFMAARLMRIFWLLGDKLGSPATRPWVWWFLLHISTYSHNHFYLQAPFCDADVFFVCETQPKAIWSSKKKTRQTNIGKELMYFLRFLLANGKATFIQ